MLLINFNITSKSHFKYRIVVEMYNICVPASVKVFSCVRLAELITGAVSESAHNCLTACSQRQEGGWR